MSGSSGLNLVVPSLTALLPGVNSVAASSLYSPSAPASPVGSARSQIPGVMAPRGRKRKAEAAVVSTSEKREKLENGKEQVEEAIVIEHCTS